VLYLSHLLTAIARLPGLFGTGYDPARVVNALVSPDQFRVLPDQPYGEAPRQMLDVYRPANDDGGGGRRRRTSSTAPRRRSIMVTPLEVVADLVFHRSCRCRRAAGSPALADDLRRAADLHLGGGDRLARSAAFSSSLIMVASIAIERACSSAISMSTGAVLQHLEAADRHAELLALLEVVDRELVHRRHRADRLGGERRNASSTTRSTSGSAAPGSPSVASARRARRERHLGGTQPVLSDSRGSQRPARSRVDEEQRDAVRSRRLAGLTRAETISWSALSPCRTRLSALDHPAECRRPSPSSRHRRGS
jgi:hypothetical protein